MKAQEQIELPSLCYCVGYGGVRGRAGGVLTHLGRGWIQFAEDMRVLSE